MVIKIQKGIPIRSRNSEVGDALRRLQVDECFDVSTDAIARSNLHVIARYAGIEITVRTIVDEQTGKKFYRVWRTK